MFNRFVNQLNRGRKYGKSDGSGVEPLRYAYDAENETHRYNYSAPDRPQKTLPAYSNTRLFLRVYSIFASIAIIAGIAHTLTIYHSTRDATMRWPHGNTLSAWPAKGAQLGPSHAVLGAAAFTLAWNILAFVTMCGFLKSVRAGCFGRFTSGTFSLLTILIWAGVLAYSRLPPKYSFVSTDLYNWSCERKGSEIIGDRETLGLSSICRETSAAWALGLLIGIAELVDFLAILIALRRGGSSGSRRSASGGLIPFQAKAYRKLDAQAPGQEMPMMAQSDIQMMERAEIPTTERTEYRGTMS